MISSRLTCTAQASQARSEKIEATEDWNPLPLFPWLAATAPVYRDERRVPFDDPFLLEMINAGPIQRLKGIGFLGALDHVLYSTGDDVYRRRHNRYDHSIGVAKLAESFASTRELSLKNRRVLIAAALLHDVGHGPLSHTLEPIFKSKFGITHHSAGHEIILGRSPLGIEIISTMRTYGLDVDEVIAMIEGKHDAPYAYLFSSPINFDTLEGITRTSLFSAAQKTNIRPERIVDSIARSTQLPVDALDAFWLLKHRVYKLFIHNSVALIFDGLAQAYMTKEIDSFLPKDFLKTELQLRHKHPVLFQLLAWTRASRHRVQTRVAHLFADLLDYELEAPIRTFDITHENPLREPVDLWLRYQQSKRPRQQTIGGIFAMLQQTVLDNKEKASGEGRLARPG